jgi:2-phosphoglycerate kinase
MIIWLNGAFGAGKTTCAFELHRRLPHSFVYDPEHVGYMIRKNMPKELHKPDFQDHEQWRSFNYALLSKVAAEYEGTIIVPMTVVNRAYYDELIQRLRDDGFELRHFILYAQKETLRKRLNKRLERGETWAKAQIDRCLHAFDHDITETKLVTDNRSIDSIVAEIAEQCGIALLPDNRSRFKKALDQIQVLIRHIR